MPSVKQNGLGFMEPELVATTASTVKTYMGVANLPAVDKLYTNQFVGSVKLSDAEWSAVESRSQKFLPKKAG